MSQSQPPRSTLYSFRHLNPDFQWETFPDLPSFDDNPGEQFAERSQSAPPTAARKLKDAKKSGSGAIPKKQKTQEPAHDAVKPAKQPHGTPPASADEIQRLKLQKETQELEIRKLELRLQLAKLENPTQAATTPDSTAGKSLGDLKAPQKTLFSQQWPHIYSPGEPKLYSDLSLAEFCAGFLVIIQQNISSPLIASYINHFHNLMVLASTYQWSAVRSFHYKVLRSIELGLVKWGDNFEHLRQPFFTPSTLLPTAPAIAGKPSNKPTSTSTPSQPTIPRHQICDLWSWYNDCSASDCPKLHVCVVCKRSDHQALSCPKRKFPVPSRRTDPVSRD